AVRSVLRTPSATVGLAVVLFWVGCASFWPLVVPYDPAAQDATALLARPSAAHLFGTDHLGRDVLSRVLAGSREVLLLAPAATLLGLLGGIAVGLSAAYYRGWYDEVLMRVMDAVMAFPFIILALLILAVTGPSARNVILVIGLAYIPLTGRVVRAAALSVRDLDYVAAARLRGARGPDIMVTEILPNITGPIVVEATIRVGYAIFAAASLSFLGLGVPPPSPNWGAMINETRLYLTLNPAIVLAPTLAIASLVVAVNLVADGLRRAVRA
ncbi:MAG: ABC transporter permease, partial [Chloroflexota bacterium]|nr:ABC transporter permease [Chloroflexota bacterium]